MDSSHVEHDLVNILFTEEQIQQRLGEMADQITADYEGRDLLVVGVLRGAVMVMADLARAMPRPPGDGLDGGQLLRLGHQVQRRGADPQGPRHRHQRSRRADRRRDHRHRPDAELAGQQPLSRSPASVEIATLLRKPEALSMPVEPKYVGWDIPNEFVVGYGLDYRERYRNLRDIGTLAPHVYS